MKKFDYFQPETLKEAFTLMENTKGEVAYVAGGTDLIVRLKQGVVRLDALISLRRIEELRGIQMNGELIFGSMTLFRDIERSPEIAKEYPALHQAAVVLANPQIRNVATIGGNLCNAAPSADSAPPLLVLDAEVVLQGPGGTRQVPLVDFFKGPGATSKEQQEILTQIKIPKPEKNTCMAFLKIGRVSQDIAIANASALLTMDGGICRKCRLAVGAVAPVPLRLKDVEKKIEGQKIDKDLLKEVERMVCEAVSPITDVRSTAEYRRTVSGVLIRRAIEQAISSLQNQ